MATPPSATSSQGPTAQPGPARQPLLMQRNPLLAGSAAGVAGSWIGHMLFGATNSSAASTTDAGEQVGEASRPPGGPAPPGYSCFSCFWEPERSFIS